MRFSAALTAVGSLLVCACAPGPVAGGPASRSGAGQSGVQAEVVTAAKWSLPAVGAATPIALALRLTNASGAPLRFHLLDTIRISLSDDSGRPIPCEGGRDVTLAAPTVTGEVLPESHIDLPRDASLTWTGEGDVLRLNGPDGFGGLWQFDGLRPGVYAVQFTYENRQPIVAGKEVWTGRVVTPAVTVRLDEPVALQR